MNEHKEKNQLDILNELANLLASKSSPYETVLSVVGYIKKILEADRVCAVVFFGYDEAKVFCDKNGVCDKCGDTELITQFAKRMTTLTTAPLAGGVLLSMLTDAEKERFRFQYPLLFPISFGEQILGVLWCDGPFDEKNMVVKKEQLTIMYALICVAFWNVLFYELQRTQERALTSILDNLDANIYVSDLSNDDILFINKKMMKEFGLSSNVTGQKCWKVLQEGFTERCSFCPSIKLFRNPDEQIVWEEFNTATKRYYKNTDSVIEWLDGNLVHLQHSVDITAEKAIMQSMEEAKIQAEEAKIQAELASSAKSDFLSRMSHEIRTPINAIIGMSRIASESFDLAKTHECIKKIDSSSKQLLHIVTDILDMSKIEANKMELSSVRFDFEKMLIDISNIISIRAEEKQQKLHIHMDMSMPRFFKGDEIRLSQVITNLLSNAVKFTPDLGTVNMGVREKSVEDGKSRIEVRISDTGIGIPKEQQKMLFKSFEQGDGGIARKFGGTGLGLAIAKNIVEMMGGNILVESTVGKGSVFTCDVLLEQTEPDVNTPKELFKGADVSNLRVLFLDQEEDTRIYFEKIMDSFNMQSRTVATIDECFQALEEARQKREDFNLVFVDWGIAPGKGAELCAQIKAQFGSCIIVLISSMQWSDVKEHTRNYGITRHLSKPLFPSTIFNVINEAIGLHAGQSDIVQTKRYRFSGYHILLAEDLEINREIIYQALKDTKVKISSASNGRIALDMFKQNPTAYDLILMDVNMPEMDGYEATRKIRELPHEWAKEVPILAMTANAFVEDVSKSMEVGMNDHITKPLDFDILFSKLHHYLDKHTRKVTAEDAEKAPVKAAESSNGALDTQGLVDIDAALKRLNGNARVYKTILSSFIKHSGFDELAKNFKEKDIKAALQTAHSIKGVSGNLSLVAVYQNMVELEEKLKNDMLDMDIYLASVENFEKTKRVIDTILEKI